MTESDAKILAIVENNYVILDSRYCILILEVGVKEPDTGDIEGIERTRCNEAK